MQAMGNNDDITWSTIIMVQDVKKSSSYKDPDDFDSLVNCTYALAMFENKDDAVLFKSVY